MSAGGGLTSISIHPEASTGCIVFRAVCFVRGFGMSAGGSITSFIQEGGLAGCTVYFAVCFVRGFVRFHIHIHPTFFRGPGGLLVGPVHQQDMLVCGRSSLLPGKGYFPLDSEYQEYLKSVPKSTEKSACNYHKVVNKQDKKKFKNMVITGTVNCQCSHVFMLSCVDLPETVKALLLTTSSRDIQPTPSLFALAALTFVTRDRESGSAPSGGSWEDWKHIGDWVIAGPPKAGQTI
ncbi:hypothetical protein B0H13DRAFT_1853452 [Mycena leptocephala]|nr:hypothetical protein B0H13DRAFT_1853452 [Mycena leptocephala]